MALFPLTSNFVGDFVLQLVPVDTEHTMDEVAAAAAVHSVGRRVRARPGHILRVRRHGDECAGCRRKGGVQWVPPVGHLLRHMFLLCGWRVGQSPLARSSWRSFLFDKPCLYWIHKACQSREHFPRIGASKDGGIATIGGRAGRGSVSPPAGCSR